jgi:EAL domain-containing protein (putative c-di-GMP-specific phosphodiesterase class I)/GGDEF domain-containing protein
MSLINQIRIAFFLVIIATATGSLVFSTLDSKRYLEEELQKKNNDNANVLALSLSQMEKDPTSIDLFISAQFDIGHYRHIGLYTPEGKEITERINPDSKTQAPKWFTNLMPISVNPGFGNIQSGWSQYGTIHVESDVNFAYDKLWNAVKNMLIWVLSIGLLTYIVCGQLLKRILRPLDDIVLQAQAMGERRFISIDEPATSEFKAVVREMNHLSNRIKKTIHTESERLEELRLKTNYDIVTGLMHRDYFMNSIQASLDRESYSDGALIILRIANLADIDATLGYSETNTLLRHIGESILGLNPADAAVVSGRISGADLAIFCAHPLDDIAFANQYREAVIQVAMPNSSDDVCLRFLGVFTKVNKIDDVSHLFKALDFILDMASLSEDNYLRMINANGILAGQQQQLAEWRGKLENALANKRIKLEFYPVVGSKGKLLHYESPVRLQLEADSKWLSAGEFIHWATQLDVMKTIDALVLETAITTLKKTKHPICLNVSESAMRNPQYIETAMALVQQHLSKPALLSFEVPEIAAFSHIKAFRRFCSQLKSVGCRVGIEHVCLRIARLAELHDVGLDYMKFDASLVRSIDGNETNQTLLRGLCLVAHSIGIQAIAEGVMTDEEMATLKEIGMDGMTGPGVKL